VPVVDVAVHLAASLVDLPVGVWLQDLDDRAELGHALEWSDRQVGAGPVRVENIAGEEQVPAAVRVLEGVRVDGEALVVREVQPEIGERPQWVVSHRHTDVVTRDVMADGVEHPPAPVGVGDLGSPVVRPKRWICALQGSAVAAPCQEVVGGEHDELPAVIVEAFGARPIGDIALASPDHEWIGEIAVIEPHARAPATVHSRWDAWSG
jgi:hypothetical protein